MLGEALVRQEDDMTLYRSLSRIAPLRALETWARIPSRMAVAADESMVTWTSRAVCDEFRVRRVLVAALVVTDQESGIFDEGVPWRDPFVLQSFGPVRPAMGSGKGSGRCSGPAGPSAWPSQ